MKRFHCSFHVYDFDRRAVIVVMNSVGSAWENGERIEHAIDSMKTRSLAKENSPGLFNFEKI